MTAARSASSLRVALVAGEASGDTLGSGLMDAIRARVPQAQFFGIGGARMRASGCEAWHGAEELSVMGLAEVLPHLRRLLKLRRGLIARLLRERPDVFVGIDSPDFNLPVAAALKAARIPTVQYVSPQVWATRQSRVIGIRKSVDLVLCVLPFEPDFYAAHGVRAEFVGHPLADAIPTTVDAAGARRALGLDLRSQVVALLPGSRRSEVVRLSRPFLATGAWLKAHRPIEIVVALASESMGDEFRAATEGVKLDPPAKLVTGRAQEVMAAADAVLTASGTASLEALLLKRPMVVAYRMAAVSYWILRCMGIARLKHFSLPNLLAGHELVAEYVQGQVRAEILGPAVLECLDGRMRDPDWRAEFARIHDQLRRGASGTAAQAVLGLVGRGAL